MDETSSQNPFGPNYAFMSYETKVIYKYNRMKDFIKIKYVDQQFVNYEQCRYIGTIIMCLAGGYFGAAIFRTYKAIYLVYIIKFLS
jgi:hypothetical protein